MRSTLPNAANAHLDLRKLQNYCLNPDHPRGGDKARVLRAAVGLSALDAEWLRSQILSEVKLVDALPGTIDGHGGRYRVDIMIARQGREVVIRTGWIIRSGEDVPRFVSCWVL